MSYSMREIADRNCERTDKRTTIRAVAIDLDGTLLDTVGELAAAINAMLARIGHPDTAAIDRREVMATLSPRVLPENAIRNMVGKGMANLVNRALTASIGHEPS